MLLTPIAITKDNLDKAERIGEAEVAIAMPSAAGTGARGAGRLLRIERRSR